MNPFITLSQKYPGREYLAENCSINKVKIVKLPFAETVDEIEGKTAMELFSTAVFIEQIKKKSTELKLNTHENRIEEKDLPRYLGECLNSPEESVRKAAAEVAAFMGRRLGYTLLTLKMGLKENQEVRKDWTAENWAYWANAEHIILVGGLASGILGSFLKAEMEQIFLKAGVAPYHIILSEDSSNMGVKGCITQIREEQGVFPVFDFGQTNIKRSIVEKRNGSPVKITTLPSRNSKYMELDLKGDLCLQEAIKLHEYLLGIILETYESLPDWGIELVISIANYTSHGQLNPVRGGYAKLAALSLNYEEYLQRAISDVLRKKIKVRLIHDGTAVALNFRDYKNAACITIGTFFGVGFPEIQL